MKPTTLFNKFDVTKTGIRITADKPAKADYLAAAREYLDLIYASRFKLGDLLHQFREQFGSTEVQAYLIPHLAALTNPKAGNTRSRDEPFQELSRR